MHQKLIDVLGKYVAEDKSHREGDDRPEKPHAQLDQVIE